MASDATRHHAPTRSQQGAALILCMLLVLMGGVLTITSLDMARMQVVSARHAENELRARHAAESGIQLAITRLADARDLASVANPWTGIEGLDTDAATGVGGYTQIISQWPLRNLAGDTTAEIDCFIDLDKQSAEVTVASVSCYCYVPSKAAVQGSQSDAVRDEAHISVRLEYRSSEVFDYATFTNHWGKWFSDHTLVNGNTGANGDFSFDNSSATINGLPRFRASNGVDLIGYLDENGDGLQDGNDGGVYAGLDIIDAGNVRGTGGIAGNQHAQRGVVPMPNLSSLEQYEQLSMASGGTISIGGTTHVDGVLGDSPSEPVNVYLEGTLANPIVLNGPVVVRGSVIIKGYVSGQGSIYALGNVFIPDDIIYSNPLTSDFPSTTTEAGLESWRAANASADSLGLFAGENICLGDVTHQWYADYIDAWMQRDENKSDEDCGLDGIHNTGDAGEGDGVWDVSYYTAHDAVAGLIPNGADVGDPIAGTGEDLDGDGVYDDRTQLSDFQLPTPLNSSTWGGNTPGGGSDVAYNTVSTFAFDRIDAAMYTNHAWTSITTKASGTGKVKINGTIVSRNRAGFYTGDGIEFNYDARLAGRGGDSFGYYTPFAWNPLGVSDWHFTKGVDPADLVTVQE